jgi:hypothetical protein
VSNLEDRDLVTPIIDEINDSVLSLPQSVSVGGSGEFLRALRPGIGSESMNPLNDALTIGLGP